MDILHKKDTVSLFVLRKVAQGIGKSEQDFRTEYPGAIVRVPALAATPMVRPGETFEAVKSAAILAWQQSHRYR